MTLIDFSLTFVAGWFCSAVWHYFRHGKELDRQIARVEAIQVKLAAVEKDQSG